MPSALRVSYLLAGVLGLAVALPTFAQEPRESDYLGTFVYVSAQRGDQDVPQDRLDGTIVVSPGQIALNGPDGETGFLIQYQVADDQGPIKIRMEIVESFMEDTVGSKAQGLVKQEDGLTTLIYRYGDDAFPDDFQPDGPTEHLIVMKKPAAPKLVGTYEYLKGVTVNGETEGEDSGTSTIEITEDAFRLISPDGTVTFVMEYTVEKVGEELQVTIEVVESVLQDSIGSVAKGLIKVDGDELSLIYDFGENADYPQSFKPDSPTQILHIIKRMADL